MKDVELNRETNELVEVGHAKKVTLYEWPASQNCMECKHGEPVQFINENEGVATCLCMRACVGNDGVDCPEKTKVETDPLASNPNAPPFPV